MPTTLLRPSPRRIVDLGDPDTFNPTEHVRNLHGGQWQYHDVDSDDALYIDRYVYRHGTLLCELTWDIYGRLVEFRGYVGDGSIAEQRGLNSIMRTAGVPVFYSRAIRGLEFCYALGDEDHPGVTFNDKIRRCGVRFAAYRFPRLRGVAADRAATAA